MVRFLPLFLFLFSSVFAQSVKDSTSATSTKPPVVTQEVSEDGKEPTPSDSTSPSDNPALRAYFDGNAASNTADPSTNTALAPESYTAGLPSAWGPFFFLLVLILLVYIIIRWVKYRVQNLKISENPVDFIRTLATIPITSHIQMVLVDIGGKYYLMGASSHSLELLMEITDPDLIFKVQSMPLNRTPRRFSEIFLDLLGMRSNKKVTPLQAEDQLKKFIETQKDRIGKI